jgi:two-component system, NarL family, nitrate/nitrite response regulator NarL
MAHLLVTQRSLPPAQQPALQRWCEAFAGGRTVSPAQAAQTAQASDLLWLMTTEADWQTPLQSLAAPSPGLRVVVMSPAPDTAEGAKALNLGARGYVHLYSSPDLFQQVAVVVDNGGLWVGAELMQRLVAATRQLVTPGARARRSLVAVDPDGADSTPAPATDRSVPMGLTALAAAGLSLREAEVALSVADGLSNREVAAKLDITERTVKAHLSAAFDKMGVRDRLQLVLRVAGPRA